MTSTELLLGSKQSGMDLGEAEFLRTKDKDRYIFGKNSYLIVTPALKADEASSELVYALTQYDTATAIVTEQAEMGVLDTALDTLAIEDETDLSEDDLANTGVTHQLRNATARKFKMEKREAQPSSAAISAQLTRENTYKI